MTKLLQFAREALRSISNTNGFDRLAKPLRLVEASDNGKLKYEFNVDSSVVNINKSLHGGYIAYLADHTTTAALVSCHQDNLRGVSVDMNISFMRAAKLNELITVETECKKLGKTLAFLEAIFKDSNGKIVATARHTKFVGGK